jgi:hypothetical protein
MLQHVAVAAILVSALAAGAAEPPRAKELETQRVGDVTYFRVTIEPPEDLELPDIAEKQELQQPSEWLRRQLGTLPRLVAQDKVNREIYYKFQLPLKGRELTFLGRVAGGVPGEFLLIYPDKSGAAALKKKELFADDLFPTEQMRELRPTTEVKLTLDPTKAKSVSRGVIGQMDFDEQWARARARYFAVQELLTPEFGYYGLARELTGRKYKVPAEALLKPATSEFTRSRLYEMTTGAAALTESLAQQRLLNVRLEDPAERKIAVAKITGIDVAEHPWAKMMGDKKPAAEAPATLVPDDNYYVSFHDLRAFLTFGELLDLWGGNIMRTVEIHSRDYHIRDRYEKQLCLPSAKLVPKVARLVRDIAITGSDLAFRTGTDVSVIFQVSDREAFLAAAEPFIDLARKEYGKELLEEKHKYGGVEIESFSTQFREVSLYRASAGDFVIYANSHTALEGILDTRAGKHKPMSEALDFQYMRTIFVRDEKQEDAFAFLPDAFIRRLVGPVTKIKEKRRLEALTSLQLATHAALYVATQTGKLPVSTKDLLADSGLRPEELAVPEGPGVTWVKDDKRTLATSKVYNTLQFATPLCELPLDKVTKQEERDYQDFRTGYLRLWRRYFDPMAFRLKVDDKQVRLEAYILPLLQSSQYNSLRDITGGDGIKLNLDRLTPNMLAQLFLHLDLGQNDKIWGDWFSIRLDDSPLWRQQVELQIRRQLDPSIGAKAEEQLFYKLPLTIGLGAKDGPAVAKAFHDAWEQCGLGDGEQKLIEYRGVEIKSAPVNKKKYLQLLGTLKGFAALSEEGEFIGSLLELLPGKEAPATLYVALIDDGYYVSLNEDSLKKLIDAAKDKKDGKKGETDPLNASFFLATSAPKTLEALQLYFEWESHKQALGNNAVWLALEHAGVIPARATSAEREQVAFQLLGFTPVSPDGAVYGYNRKTDLVINKRHGSYERERLHGALDASAPLLALLQQIKTIRADLCFREDGIHTTLTLERPDRKK